jgi:hypothetical protein
MLYNTVMLENVLKYDVKRENKLIVNSQNSVLLQHMIYNYLFM